MAGVLQHLRSSALNKRPNPASMVDGQVAINYASGSPGAFFKDTNGNLVKVGPVHVGATAPNVSPASGGTAGNGLGEQWLDTSGGTYVFKIWDGAAWRSEAGEFVNSTGDTMTGSLTMGPSANLIFEGSTDDGFETTLTVVDPTADRTITLPNVSGTVVTTGDSGTVTSTMIADGAIVNADVNASAAIAGTKISPNFGSQTITTTGIVSAALGAAATPSITFTGDTNTGIYSPGSDQVAISTGGSGRLFIGSTGSVGVGANAATNSFEVVGSAGIIGTPGVAPALRIQAGTGVTDGFSRGSIQFYDQAGTGGFVLEGAQDAGRIRLSTRSGGANSERLSVTSTGTVNIVGAGTAGVTQAVSFNGSAPVNSLVIDSSGRLLVGTSSAVSAAFVNSSIQAHGLTGDASSVTLYRFTTSATAAASPRLVMARSGSDSKDFTVVANGNRLGQFNFVGADGTQFVSAASIDCEVDGTPGLNDMPGRLVFSTTFDGAASPTERMRITNDGVMCYAQAAPVSYAAAATLVVGDLKNGLVQYTGAAATLTLPTGTLTEGGFSSIYTNMTFEWSVINTGSGTCTVGNGTGHTVTGSATVAAGASGRFASRRTAANTFVSYRLS